MDYILFDYNLTNGIIYIIVPQRKFNSTAAPERLFYFFLWFKNSPGIEWTHVDIEMPMQTADMMIYDLFRQWLSCTNATCIKSGLIDEALQSCNCYVSLAFWQKQYFMLHILSI